MNPQCHALVLGPDALFIAPRCDAAYSPPTVPLPETHAPHWRNRKEKMRLLDPCPELTQAAELREQAEALFRATLYLFGGCVAALVLSIIIAIFCIA